MTAVDRLRAEIRKRPRVRAAADYTLTRVMRATSMAAHVAAAPRSTQPDLIARQTLRGEFDQFAAASDGRLPMRWDERLPVYGERTGSVAFEPHYLYHAAWAARCLAQIAPERHVDISSSLQFIAIVSASVPVDYYEFRPTQLRGLPGLETHAGDLMGLPFADGSIASLSCLHVVEHLGLGRYGDPVDPQADQRAFAELRRVLAPGGDLLFATPVGPPRVRFNAHRVYSVDLVLQELRGLELVEFALVLEDGSGLIYGDEALAAVPHQTQTENAGTGCFWLRRPA
jgi:SAM-dependent methyltransferase